MRFEDIRPELKKRLNGCTHVVVKLGTGLLTPEFDRGNLDFFHTLAREIRALLEAGKKPIIVSSGAVGLGKKILKKYSNADVSVASVVEKQALASLGQSLLIDNYRQSFAAENLAAAQILVSRSDFESRHHYRNLKNTLDQLHEWKCIPVINENDAVATEELKFGDNDRISGLIAGLFPEALLIILTNVDGFQIGGERVPWLDSVSPEQLAEAGSPSEGGSGGMYSKVYTASNVIRSGQVMNISSGKDPSVISRLLVAEESGTWFFSPDSGGRLDTRRRWLLNNQHYDGIITVDSGAVQALRKGRNSLLIVGVNSVSGNFSEGDVLLVRDEEKNTVAKGIASAGSREISENLTAKKNHRGFEVIHLDHLLVL